MKFHTNTLVSLLCPEVVEWRKGPQFPELIVAIIGLLLEGENIGYIRAVDSFSAITKAIVNALASKFSVLGREKILEIIKHSSLITNKELPNKIWEALEKDGIILRQKESYELNMRKWRSL